MPLLPPTDRLPDGGLPYAETDLAAAIKEPWNTASLLPFALIIGYWVWRLELGRGGAWRQQAFLTAALPLIALSLVGGVLYHATRSAALWLVMDWLPIALLLMALAVQQWLRALPARWGLGRWALALGLPLALVLLSGALMRAALPLQARINLNYALLALAALLPIGLRLWQAGGRHGGWVLAALACFGAAVACRAADRALLDVLPMGTHWLWHLGGAAATACLTQYVYRSEADIVAGGAPTGRVSSASSRPGAA